MIVTKITVLHLTKHFTLVLFIVFHLFKHISLGWKTQSLEEKSLKIVTETTNTNGVHDKNERLSQNTEKQAMKW